MTTAWTRSLVGVLAATLLLAAISADATQIRHWQRTPIHINLPVGTERIVVFGDNVRVGLPPGLAKPKTLRVQSDAGAVYLKAHKAFATQRVQVQDLNTGRIILLDLDAKPKASHETIRIVQEPVDQSAGNGTSADTNQSSASKIPAAAFGHRSETGAPMAVRLVRHAAQALYAPARLLHGSAGIQRVALSTRQTLPGLLPTLPVTVKPLAAWRGGPFIVTALQITNNDPTRTFTLDPRALEGNFYAASFMQSTLGPANSLTDTTTLFAVTRNGDLSDALNAPYGDQASEARHAH